MKLQYKIAAGILGVCVFGFFVAEFWVKRVVEETIIQLEDRDAELKLRQLQQSLKNKEDFLTGKMRDWARWDDTYDFVKGKKPDYIQDNFRNPEQFFTNLKIDFFAILNDEKETLFDISFDYEKKAVSKRSKEMHDLFKTFRPKEDTIGFVPFQDSVLFLVSIPVTTTDLNGDPFGLLIAGFFVNDQFYSQIEELTQLKLKPAPISQSKVPTFNKINENDLVISVPIFSKQSKSHIFNIEVTLERTIFETFLKAKKHLSTIMLTTFATLLLISIVFAKFFISNRLEKLRLALAKVDFSNVSECEIGFDPSKDEIGVISNSLKAMLDQLKIDKDYIEKQNSALIHSERLKAIGEMAGGIAHEINNPLAIISGRVKQLVRESSSSTPNLNKITELGDKIELTIERISAIIRGLRTSVRTSEKDSFEYFSINEMITETINMCDVKANRFGVQLIVQMDATNFLKVEGQRVPLSQVLLNLVSNAVDELSKSKKDKWVKIVTQIVNEKVKIIVVDAGEGIPPHVASKLFQPFFTTKEVGQGTGLGLSISKGIVDSHGGSLYLDKNHKNTCFVIELPLKHQTSKAA